MRPLSIVSWCKVLQNWTWAGRRVPNPVSIVSSTQGVTKKRHHVNRGNDQSVSIVSSTQGVTKSAGEKFYISGEPDRLFRLGYPAKELFVRAEGILNWCLNRLIDARLPKARKRLRLRLRKTRSISIASISNLPPKLSLRQPNKHNNPKKLNSFYFPPSQIAALIPLASISVSISISFYRLSTQGYYKFCAMEC